MNNIQVTSAADIIGEWGPWQRKLIIFFTCVYAISPFQNLGIMFYAPKIKFWCVRPEGYENITLSTECKSYTNINESCSNWEYDTSIFESTIIAEWNLVCDRSWLASAAASSYQFGYAVSALLFGYLSDKYGRLPIMKIAIILEIVSGFCQALSLSIEMFMISRFFLGLTAYGRYLTGYLLIMECVGCSYRAAISVVIEAGWVVGYLLLPGLAYALRNFRYMQITVSSLELISLIWLWQMPESPRWQLTNGHIDEAESAIKNAAVVNGKFTEEEIEQKIELLKEYVNREERAKEVNKQSLLDMWRVGKLFKYSMVLYCSWFINSFVYYGLSLNVGDLGGNLFINCFIYALAELASNVFLYFAFMKCGRRPLFVSLMLGAAITCFAIIPFLFNESFILYRVVIAMIGKFCITSTYHLIYLQTAEIIPTSLRQIGVGSCSVAARVGSVIAPFVKELSALTHPSVTMSLFGSLGTLNALLALILPETKGVEIPDTINEAKKMGKSLTEIKLEPDFDNKEKDVEKL
ncbi:organic cation transporter protein-like protein [Leptotrombidium deliense]|uniref:Organic cation transporter protein-like protein n=1 Tax=Leptotrombidium deliense TaxID=299467 RepID=A0A443S981_9ACAR|nr:organic cation transporter protein-like protein [Leptotrombidium deliense]